MNKLANTLLIAMANATEDYMEQVSIESGRVMKKHGPLSKKMEGLPELHEFLRAQQNIILHFMAEHKAKADIMP